MRNKLRIALVQMTCEKDAIIDNLAITARVLAQAADLKTDIVAFPESSITGYIDPARYPETALHLDGPEVRKLLSLTEGYAPLILPGLMEYCPGGPPYITQLVVRDGQVLGIYRKNTIVDEEAGLYTPGQDVPVFTLDDLTFGIAICADIGNRQVYAACAQKGAQIVFELAAPGLYGEQETRNWASGYAWWEGECRQYLSQYTRDFGYWVAAATQAGRTVDEDFPGGGYVFAPNGQRLYATSDWSPNVVYLDIDFVTQTVNVEGVYPL